MRAINKTDDISNNTKSVGLFYIWWIIIGLSNWSKEQKIIKNNKKKTTYQLVYLSLLGVLKQLDVMVAGPMKVVYMDFFVAELLKHVLADIMDMNILNQMSYMVILNVFLIYFHLLFPYLLFYYYFQMVLIADVIY